MRASTLPRGRDTAMLRLYAWMMIVTTGLSIAVALHVTQSDPRYSATAEILIDPTITPSGNFIAPSMPTEQRVATSTEVISTAAAELGVTARQPLQHLSVSVPVDTQVLVMSYTAGTPEAALEGAKVFARTYLKVRNPPGGKNPVAKMVSPPTLPSAPVGANYPVILGVAVLAGLLTGFGAARAWDRVRGRIRTIDDAERCADLDALAVTPALTRRSTGNDPRVRAGRAQLDSLAARVLGRVEGGPPSSLLVTGAAPGCGSSTVAALTALALARMGRVVVLVTADDEVVARMSRDRNSAKVGAAHGSAWPKARSTTHEGLHVVPVGEWDDAGAAAAGLTDLIPELHERLPEALIVIDGPPAWRSAGMALRADKILLVVALGRCSRTSTIAAVQALDHDTDKLMGLVITPRRRRLREGFATARAWATRQVTALRFWINPTSGGFAPAPARWPGPHTDPRGWTRPASREDLRPGAAGSDLNGDAGRLPQPSPNGEPTSPVLS
jgi:Mrp family chromosome partitioning ATPase